MSAPTAHVRFVLARAGVRESGLMHLSSERNTGALNPMCGANPVRSAEIRTWASVPLDLSALCADCAAVVLGHPDVQSIEQGLAVWLRAEGAAASVRLLELAPGAIAVDAAAHRAVDESSDAFAQLVQSVLEHGVLQPVTVRRTSSGLQLVIGRRRLAAAIAAGLERIPALVREASDEQATLDALTENLHRADLNPIEAALAYQRALEQLELSQGDLAKRLHVSQAQVSNTIRLLGLPAELQELVAAGTLSAAHGRALLRLEAGSEEQAALAQQILAEGMSTRDADAAARAATAPAAAVKLPDLQLLLALALEQAGLSQPGVRVTTTGDRARIVLDVGATDLPAVLGRLQAAA